MDDIAVSPGKGRFEQEILDSRSTVRPEPNPHKLLECYENQENIKKDKLKSRIVQNPEIITKNKLTYFVEPLEEVE